MRLPYLLSASWPQLKSLNFSDCSFRDQDIVSFNQGNWPLLESLDLCKNGLQNHNIEQLTGADWPLLHDLNLCDSRLTTAVIPILVKSNWSLQALYLDHLNSDKDLGVGPCKQIVEAQWVNLRTLHLIQCYFGDDGLSMLVTAKWNNLQHLRLDDCDLDPSSMVLLSEGCWPYLTSLSLRLNYIGSAGMTALVNATWPLLEAFDVERNDIGPSGCVALSKSTWQNLKFLNISNNCVEGTGVEHLMKADWPLLKSLCMRAVGLFEHCKALVSAKGNWPELTRLHLGQNSFPLNFDEGGPSVERLDLSKTCVHSSGTHPMGKPGWGSLKRLCLCGIMGTYQHTRPPIAVCSMLECLDLSACKLISFYDEGYSSKFGAANLLSACWPRMQFLKLADSALNQVSVERLVTVGRNWPLLTVLDLHGNNIDSAAIAKLVSGNWSLLQALDRTSNRLDEAAIHILVKAHPWPLLEKLHLDDFQLRLLHKELTNSSFEVYPDYVSEVDKAQVAQLARCHWPRLKQFLDTGPLDFSVSNRWLQFW